MAKKTILFDLDGTLTDSAEGILNSVVQVLSHYHIPIPTQEGLRVFIGPPLHDKFVEFGVPAEEADAAVELFRSRYNTIGKFENKPYPGIPEMLDSLQKSGFRLLVATSKPEKTAKEVLEHFDLAKYFHQICGASMDRSRDTKDKVIAYLLAQEASGTDMIMVGDTDYDVTGAAAHGIPCIGVSWGYGSVAEMEAAGAVDIAHSVSELMILMEK